MVNAHSNEREKEKHFRADLPASFPVHFFFLRGIIG
jgi:hypothetical protein